GALQVNAGSIARGPIDTLAAVGGLEIAGLVGVILAAAEGRKPAIIDGFISGASALVAAAMEPAASGYMIASHRSQELGHGAVLDRLGLHPLLDLDLPHAEGTKACAGACVKCAGSPESRLEPRTNEERSVQNGGRRVVITGIGAVTPIGTGADGLWTGLAARSSAVREITRFDPAPFRSRIAAGIPDFRPQDHLDAK